MRMETTRTRNVAGAVDAVRGQAWSLVNEAAQAMKVEAKLLVVEAVGTGVKYTSLPERSSSPYAVPVNQTGAMADSIQTYPEPLGPSIPAADCGSDNDLVRLLNDGSNRVAPRPFMTEASYAGEEVMRGSTPTIGRALKKL